MNIYNATSNYFKYSGKAQALKNGKCTVPEYPLLHFTPRKIESKIITHTVIYFTCGLQVYLT